MNTLRRLILLNTALLVLLGYGMALFVPRSFPVEYPEGRLYQQMATLRFLGMSLGGLALVLMMTNGVSLLGDRRTLARWLAFADVLIGLMALAQQTTIWGSLVGWILVLVPFGLAVALIRASLEPLKPEEIAAEVAGLQIPGEMRKALLQQVGEAATQEERNRLARDLHDSIKQQLFSINVGTATAQERWERDPEGARTALADVRRSAREAMVEMQALLHQLRPRALASTAGLVEALREQGEALGYRSGAQVTVELGPEVPDDRLPPGTYEALFRIAQEALANVARHARASHVCLWLGSEGDSALLRVEDDGQGFHPAATSPGMGLRNLRERAQSLGGSIEITAKQAAGTAIAVRLPLIPRPRKQELRLEMAMLPRKQESRIETAIREERSNLMLWLVYAQIFFTAVPENPARPDSFQMVLPLLMLFGLLATAAGSWWRARAAVKATPGANPATVFQLQYLGNRSRIFHLLLGSCGALRLRGVTPAAWSGGRIAWAAVALCFVSLAGIELILFHRKTRLRRSLPVIRWLRPATWSIQTWGTVFLAVLTVLIVIMNLQKLATPQILGLYAGGAVLAYVLTRQPRREGASR